MFDFVAKLFDSIMTVCDEVFDSYFESFKRNVMGEGLNHTTTQYRGERSFDKSWGKIDDQTKRLLKN